MDEVHSAFVPSRPPHDRKTAICPETNHLPTTRHCDFCGKRHEHAKSGWDTKAPTHTFSLIDENALYDNELPRSSPLFLAGKSCTRFKGRGPLRPDLKPPGAKLRYAGSL